LLRGDWAKVFLEVDRGYIMPLMKTIASYDPKQDRKDGCPSCDQIERPMELAECERSS
jgi:hypothetical protein